MAGYGKSITINLGHYESVSISVNDLPSFEECNKELLKEMKEMEISPTGTIRVVLRKKEEQNDTRKNREENKV